MRSTPKYFRTAALASSARSRTCTGPGMSLSPASQRRTVRPSDTPTRSARALAERPRRCRASLSSSGVISNGIPACVSQVDRCYAATECHHINQALFDQGGDLWGNNIGAAAIYPRVANANAGYAAIGNGGENFVLLWCEAHFVSPSLAGIIALHHQYRANGPAGPAPRIKLFRSSGDAA